MTQPRKSFRERAEEFARTMRVTNHFGTLRVQAPTTHENGFRSRSTPVIREPYRGGGSVIDIQQNIKKPPFAGEWKWSGNRGDDEVRGNSRGGVYHQPGTPYIASWEEKGSHWDVNDGASRRRERFDRWGNPITGDQAHNKDRPKQGPIEDPEAYAKKQGQPLRRIGPSTFNPAGGGRGGGGRVGLGPVVGPDIVRTDPITGQPVGGGGLLVGPPLGGGRRRGPQGR